MKLKGPVCVQLCVGTHMSCLYRWGILWEMRLLLEMGSVAVRSLNQRKRNHRHKPAGVRAQHSRKAQGMLNRTQSLHHMEACDRLHGVAAIAIFSHNQLQKWEDWSTSHCEKCPSRANPTKNSSVRMPGRLVVELEIADGHQF